jgi:hypothetical protein
VKPILTKIKRLVLAGRILWTVQAEEQLAKAGLDRQTVIEAILGAQFLGTRSRGSGNIERA